MERCSEFSTGIVLPEANTQCRSVPFQKMCKENAAASLPVLVEQHALVKQQQRVACLVVQSLEGR